MLYFTKNCLSKCEWVMQKMIFLKGVVNYPLLSLKTIVPRSLFFLKLSGIRRNISTSRQRYLVRNFSENWQCFYKCLMNLKEIWKIYLYSIMSRKIPKFENRKEGQSFEYIPQFRLFDRNVLLIENVCCHKRIILLIISFLSRLTSTFK